MAWVATADSAATVEVGFDVMAHTKEWVTWGSTQGALDGKEAIAPTSFSTSFFFDPESAVSIYRGEQPLGLPLSSQIRPGHAPKLVALTDLAYRGDAVLRSVTIVPEPGTWAMMAVGLAALSFNLPRKRRPARRG